MADIITVSVPEFLEDNTEYDMRYKRTMKWDPMSGDFVRDGSNNIMECSGEEGFMIWCLKAAMTERYACLAYPDEIGVEMEEAADDADAGIVESQVERTITEALEANPRTEYVGDFDFAWDGNSIHCTFNVKGVGWDRMFQVSI